MLKTQKPAMKALFVFSLILLAAALVLSVIRFFRPIESVVVLTYIRLALGILAVLSGFVYVLGGYKKNDAVYYKLFMFLVCLEAVFTLIVDLMVTPAKGYTSPVSGILRTIICVNLVILAFAKDLGKQTSIGLAGAVLGVSLFNIIRLTVLYSSFGIIADAAAGLALALLVLLLVIGKYLDKTERGTK